eukprot:5703671-Amphidinium_carterae.1
MAIAREREIIVTRTDMLFEEGGHPQESARWSWAGTAYGNARVAIPVEQVEGSPTDLGEFETPDSPVSLECQANQERRFVVLLDGGTYVIGGCKKWRDADDMSSGSLEQKNRPLSDEQVKGGAPKKHYPFAAVQDDGKAKGQSNHSLEYDLTQRRSLTETPRT